MILKNKIPLLLFGLLYTVGLFYTVKLSAQTLKGELFNMEDSLPVMFATIAFVDSAGNTLTGTSTNQEGQFNVQIPDSVQLIRIFQLPEFAELHITNLIHALSDTIDLGQLPMFKAPSHIDVQFKGISERNEGRKQRQITKDFNRLIMSHQDTVVEINNQSVKLSVKPIKQTDSERLILIYVLDFEETN